jgi:hypothetical protein
MYVPEYQGGHRDNGEIERTQESAVGGNNKLTVVPGGDKERRIDSGIRHAVTGNQVKFQGSAANLLDSFVWVRQF